MNSDKICCSPGLAVVTSSIGTVVFDPLTETAHLVSPIAAWLLSSDEPSTIDELVRIIVEETEADEQEARATLEQGVDTLTELGLLGRDEAPDRPATLVPRVREPEPGWTVGAAHGLIDRYLAFCGPDAELIEAVDDLMGAPLEGVDPTIYMGIQPVETGGIDVIDDSHWHLESADRLLWQLPAIVNYTVSHSDSMLVMHAGAVRTPHGKIVLVTGTMNTGKSTLVAALIKAGCDYLGDESIGVDADLHVWAYPKPLTLDQSAQRLVGIDPPGEPLTVGEHRRAPEIRSEAESLAGDNGLVDLVVHTAYRPDDPPRGERLNGAQALELLVSNTQNLGRVGGAGLEVLCALAESVPVVSITHGATMSVADRIVEVAADPDLLVAEHIAAPTPG